MSSWTDAASQARILVSPDFTRPDQEDQQIRLDLRYLRALESAGAIPIVAQPHGNVAELADLCDGWLITGGDDLPPELLGEPLHPEARVAHPLRIRLEQDLYRIFRESPKPILGICLGCQLLNVLEGGTLIQHLPDIPGVAEHRKTVHRVQLLPQSRLYPLLGESIEVASSHHQAVREVAPGWRVIARAEDGIVEAIERPGEPFRVGVQWHPERTPEAPETRALFATFVEAAIQARALSPQG